MGTVSGVLGAGGGTRTRDERFIGIRRNPRLPEHDQTLACRSAWKVTPSASALLGGRLGLMDISDLAALVAIGRGLKLTEWLVFVIAPGFLMPDATMITVADDRQAIATTGWHVSRCAAEKCKVKKRRSVR